MKEISKRVDIKLLPLIGILGGLFFGVNFFWSNFMIDLRPLSALLPGAGIILTHALFTVFLLLYLFARTIFTGLREESGKPTPKELYASFFLPLVCFQGILLIFTIIFSAVKRISPAVFINDYLRYFMWAWILAGFTRLTGRIESGNRYKYNAVLLGSFCFAYLLLSIVLKQVRLEAANFFR